MSVVTRTRSQNPNQVPQDREVKPLPAPILVEDDAADAEVIYETDESEEAASVESAEASAESGSVNLDDDDFWF